MKGFFGDLKEKNNVMRRGFIQKISISATEG